jgi:AICAR transformylase/IMP cyclohydrolase PurH
MNHALIAVNNPADALQLATQLHKSGWQIVYSGDVRPLWEAYVPVIPLHSIISDPVMDMRYANFSQEVYTGLTALCDDPILESFGMPYIDLLCTDLPSLQKTERGDDHSVNPAFALGIGNLSLVQYAIYGQRMVVTHRSLYPGLANWLKNENRPDEVEVRRLMWKVAQWECLRRSAAYFAYLAGYSTAVDLPYNWQKEINPEAEFHYEYDHKEGPVQILRRYFGGLTVEECREP